MITPQEARQIIDTTGIKHRKFAKAVNVHYVWLSEWLNNKRLLDNERLSRITKYCNTLRQILPPTTQ